ncbi:MAG: hypothetical protein K2Y39_16680 [Candidatus Obscuribacterales bacterium]|nr:hypothetical protein [Candidatus Obscuribacterales bacterium]
MKFARHSTIEPKYDSLTLANEECINDAQLIIAASVMADKSATWLAFPPAGQIQRRLIPILSDYGEAAP